MKILIAPPGAGKSVAAQLVSSIIDADHISALRCIYSDVTERFGPGWYFHEHATKLKDHRMREVRMAIESLVPGRAVLATSETGLVCLGDNVALALPPNDLLFSNTQQRDSAIEFRYPDLDTVTRITTYYRQWAKSNHYPIYPNVETAVFELLS